MFRSPLWILWSFPYESLTCQPSSRGYIVGLLQILWTFFTFSYWQSVKEQHGNWQSSTEVYPPLNRENHSKVSFPPHDKSPKAVLRILFVTDTFFPDLKHKFTLILSSFNRNVQLHLTHIKMNTRWEAVQRVMAAKFTRLTETTVKLLHLVAENCTTCCLVL